MRRVLKVRGMVLKGIRRKMGREVIDPSLWVTAVMGKGCIPKEV